MPRPCLPALVGLVLSLVAPAAQAGGTAPDLPDPDREGPYAFSTFVARVRVPATGHAFRIDGWLPTDSPTPGPYPLAVLAHGFRLPTRQYEGYARRLASFGWVVLNAGYPTPLFSPDHAGNARDLLGVVDWAAGAPELAGRVDANRVALIGHSLGGKVALLAAVMDARVAAVVGLDPVDASPAFCSAERCPDVSRLVHRLAIPTLLLGSTVDGGPGRFGPACAPAAHNFTTFFAEAAAPSLEVTVPGAAHLSFLDDPAACGLPCRFCRPATLPDATVSALARAYTVAFLERHLRGLAGYTAYLTGEQAERRYLAPGLATIRQR